MKPQTKATTSNDKVACELETRHCLTTAWVTISSLVDYGVRLGRQLADVPGKRCCNEDEEKDR